MRKPIILILAALIILFPPYWNSGIWTDDFGWVFLFDDYSWSTPVLSLRFFLGDFSLLVFLAELAAVVAANMIWKRSERARAADGAVAAMPVAASTHQADVAEELAKLNRLRQDGALSADEFAAQKARLMAPSAETQATTSMAQGEFPSVRIANAVQVLRDAGIPESQIIAPAHRWAWREGKALPPIPYIAAEPRYAAVLFGLAGIVYSLLMSLFGYGGSFSKFVIMAAVFGGLMWLAFVLFSNWLIAKRNLPRWQDIPG